VNHSTTIENAPAAQPAKRPNEERLYFWFPISLALIFAIGVGMTMWLVSRRETAYAVKPDHPRQLINFSLIDRTGRTVTQKEIEGKILVVDFISTACSTTCPIVNRAMAEIQRRTADKPNVQLLSLTVDPRTDTPYVLAKFGEQFGADTNRWFLLTGDKPTLYRLIETSFLARDLDNVLMPGNFTDPERIAVVDKRGNVRAFFDGVKPNTADAVIDEIVRLQTRQ
jgi:protein SCO1/2